MFRTFCAASIAALLLCPVAKPAQDGKFSLKTEKATAPKELKADVAKLLSDEAVQFLDDKGNVVCVLWLRQEVPADATPEQIKNGLTYAELKETTLLGAVKFEQAWTDYRKQKIKPGIYTLRFAVQPMDGDHMGSSPEKNFCLLVSADQDTNPAPMEPKMLIEKSMKSMGTGHPGVLMLFEHSKPGAAPQLVTKLNNHTVLNLRENVRAAGQKASIGIGLTLVGHAE
jgi:hypothetical protein